MRLARMIPFILMLICGVLIHTGLAEDAINDSSLDGPEPQCGQVNASETLSLNSTISSGLRSASFILVWTDMNSSLEMALTTPGGLRLDSSAEDVYGRDKGIVYFVVPDPEPGNWTAVITAGDGSAKVSCCLVLDLSEEPASESEIKPTSGN